MFDTTTIVCTTSLSVRRVRSRLLGHLLGIARVAVSLAVQPRISGGWGERCLLPMVIIPVCQTIPSTAGLVRGSERLGRSSGQRLTGPRDRRMSVDLADELAEEPGPVRA